MYRIAPTLALAAALLTPAAIASAQEPVQPRIVVSGEGEAAVSPDMAIITLSVMREAKTARAALDENNAAMAAVTADLKKAGVAARDLQTSGLSISPRYVYPQNNDGAEQPKIVAYQVTNTLTARIRDLSTVGQILDRSVTLGVNQGGNIAFTNDDPSAAMTTARREAVADAIAKAQTLADAADVGLGDIIEMSEQPFSQPPVPMMKARTMRMEAADSVPVEAGENSYRIQVNVTFGIKQ